MQIKISAVACVPHRVTKSYIESLLNNSQYNYKHLGESPHGADDSQRSFRFW
ncbi:conserved hypothetical protein [Xenorhabdus nematophila F1]|uniref:Uncharacterized protein n=1 Tax=Xenorhabdus nematophila (strain ATCC 19061 / DSM 3370 / CCUG 14189 / LMG 1036 / NCIMB 9965 / AN6) TaxID=406817 RepID=D3VDI4_XENNA|nr:hypothetical protein XNC1_4199 [Xenorhabdus nematophila ATCC 19061]CCW30598.1 conserved hypothetical protein [Xenorhabdus nematophila F1]CEF32110.1 hypothetical protein XNW1_4240043 [Xenorhabdus nematophila str. Websteri]